MEIPIEDHKVVGGDFSRIFEAKDYLAMLNVPDEATCVLRGHLILEEVLNIWSSKLTDTEDLFKGGFVSFKTKLNVSNNLGLPDDLSKTLNKINEIRNRFSHRKGYRIEDSAIASLQVKVDECIPSDSLRHCADFEIKGSGKDQDGKEVPILHKWDESNNRIKFLIAFIILMLKITKWMQSEFQKRGIDYTIIEVEGS